jgi:LacI family transcriptional regulator
LRRSIDLQGRTTIRDVARASGVSLTTVSFVLNDAPLAKYIPDDTKSRIHKAVKTLDYRPNVFARFLHTNRSQTVGLMMFDMTDPYCTPITRGIQSVLYQASYLPLVADVQNKRARFERSLEMLLGRRVDGLLVIANWLFMKVNLLADLEKNSTPIVMIGRELGTSSVSSVIVDNEAGGFAALEYLYSLGHRKIAFVRGPKALADTSARWRGIQNFARSRALEIKTSLVIDLPERNVSLSAFDGGLKLVRELLGRDRTFTAVVAFDDVSALGAMRALAEANIRVPHECSVIGFDDINLAAFCTPGLTTIRQPLEMMGTIAATVLLEAVGALREPVDFTPVSRKVAPELIVRGSTAVQRITKL